MATCSSPRLLPTTGPNACSNGARRARASAARPRPLRLQVKGEKPCYQGPLQLLTKARRIEGAWWDAASAEPVLRDYFVARSESAGLLWIYRERLHAGQDQPQWFLHGLYA